MNDEKWPPLDPGTRIKTYKPNTDLRKEWTDEAWHSRKWGTLGTIVRHHDSHGLCYDVKHDDGSEAPYDPSEFDTLPKLATEMVPEMPKKAEKPEKADLNLRRMVTSKELSSLIDNFGYIVIFESVRKVELVVDGATGRPFATKDEATEVARQLANDLEALTAKVLELKPHPGYSSWTA